MLTMSAGPSFQRKTTIVSPEMANQSDCYRKTGALPLYSRCDWTDEELEKVGAACQAWVKFRRTRAPVGCDTSKTMHRYQTIGHRRQLRNTNDQTGGLQKHQDNHWSTHEMPALTCVMSLFFELRKDGSVHFLSDAECEELGIYRIAPTQIVLAVPTGSGWQHFPPALPRSGYEYMMHAAENWVLMHGVEAGPLPPNIIRASAVTWYYYRRGHEFALWRPRGFSLGEDGEDVCVICSEETSTDGVLHEDVTVLICDGYKCLAEAHLQCTGLGHPKEDWLCLHGMQREGGLFAISGF